MVIFLHYMQLATTLIEAVTNLVQVIQELFHILPPIV